MPSEPVKCHLVTHKDGCRDLIHNMTPTTEYGYRAIGSSVNKYVAIQRTAYDEARSLMLETASYHTMDKPTQFCRVCGASDGRWPCAARINADEVLALLPEVP